MSFDLLLSGGSIIISQNGDFATATGSTKLKQDIIKFVTTDQGSNKYQPQIGSLVSKRLIGQVLTPENTITILQSSVQEALVSLQKLQKIQAQSQALSPAETLVAVNSIRVQRDSVEPRQLNVILKIMAADGNLVTETLTVRLT